MFQNFVELEDIYKLPKFLQTNVVITVTLTIIHDVREHF